MNEQPLWSGWNLSQPEKMTTDGQEERRYQRARESYQRLREIVETLGQSVPGIIEGKPDLVIPDATTSAVFEALHQNTPSKALRKRHNFLVKGLERGHEQLNWSVTIPSPLVTVNRKPSAVTTLSFAELHDWDALVEAHDAFPSTAELSGHALHKWLTGRWLFQLIREGALLHKRYIEQLPDAFEQGVTLTADTAFLTLAEGTQPAGEKDQEEDKEEEDETVDGSLHSKAPPEPPIEKEQRFRYRRIFLSPISQLLLLNLYQKKGKVWPHLTTKSRVPVAQCLMFYLKHISDKPPSANVSALLSMASTASALEKPPLLNHYAGKADVALSLCPSTWQRLIYRNALTATTIESAGEDVHLDFQMPNQSVKTVSDQLRQLRQLQQCFSASLVGHPGRREAINNIDEFLAVSNKSGVMVTLLANWCKKLMQKGGRVKSRLVARSAATYLSTIARPLVSHSQEFGDVSSASSDEWETLYENVLNSARTPAARAKMQNRLTDFHLFLVDTCAVPHVDLESTGGPQRRVDVNIITPAEFRRALALIEASQQPERIRTMQTLALILGYRLGLRRSECAGLMLKDIPYLFDDDPHDGEVIIRTNAYRQGKSYSATRRLPLWLLMPEERKQLIDWVKRRQGEITTAQTQKQLLFCRSGNGRLLLEDKALFHPIQTALKTVSGDNSLRYHHLRHSFVTFTLLRLLERAPGELLPREWLLDDQHTVVMPNVDADISTLAGLSPNDRPSRKRLWQLALWAGHASPDETLSSYTHLLDWILGQTSHEHFNQPLSIAQQFTLLNLPTKTALSSWRNRRKLKGPTQARVLLEYLQDDWQMYVTHDPLKDEWQLYQPPNANPLDNPMEAAFDWPEAMTIYQSLRLVEQQEIYGIPLDDAIQQTAKRFVLDPEQLRLWLDSGEALMQRKTRRTNHQFSRADNRHDRSRLVVSKSTYQPELERCMAAPIKPPVLKEAGQFFHRLLDWHQAEPTAAEESLITLRNHMQRSTGQVELPDEVAINRVRDLLRPLRCFQHVYLVVEIEITANEKKIKRYWSKATDIPHQRIELKPTPSPSGRTRYWHGNANLKITRGHYSEPRQPLWEAVRFAAFMTMLVLGLTEDT